MIATAVKTTAHGFGRSCDISSDAPGTRADRGIAHGGAKWAAVADTSPVHSVDDGRELRVDKTLLWIHHDLWFCVRRGLPLSNHLCSRGSGVMRSASAWALERGQGFTPTSGS